MDRMYVDADILGGRRYCPPPLWSMTAVWTLFSMLGELSFVISEVEHG